MNTMKQEKPAGESVKTCPLLSGRIRKNGLAACVGSRCAWYVAPNPDPWNYEAGGCALAYLAEIARGVQRL